MTINATGNEDAWQRQCLIEVTSGSTKVIRLHGLTETVDIDQGDRPYDMIALLNLGQIPKHGPMEISTITFEGYALEAGTDTTAGGDGVADIFASDAIIDSAQPLDIDLSNTLTRYRVAVLWTDDTGADDTWAGAGTGNLPLLLEIDFHFPIDTIGSRTDDTK